jgi:hypothetical protein
MKVLLTILCGIMLLFSGGCVVVLMGNTGFAAGPLILIPAAIAILNLLVVTALWGFSRPRRGVFMALAALDLIVVGLMIALWSQLGASSGSDNTLAFLLVAGLATKGLLTFFYSRKA